MTTREEIDSFRAHELWEAVSAATVRIASKTPQSATDRHTSARAGAVLAYLKAFKSVEPYLFPSDRESTANYLVGNVRTLDSQFEGWDDEGAMLSGTVAEIDNLCDSVLAAVVSGRWPSLQKESRAQAIRESADTFRSAAESSLSGIDAKIAASDSHLNDVKSQLDSIVTESTNRQSEAKTALDEIRTQLDAVDEKGSVALGKAVERVTERAAKYQEDWSTRASFALDQLELDAETGKKLIAYVSDDTMGGAYMKFAKREKWGYRLWAGAGIVVVALTLIFFYSEFDKISSLTPTAAIIKAGLSLTALGFAGFAFREAGKRQRQSVEARYRALDLLTLRPFTDGMEPTQQLEFRSLLGQRLFGSPVDSLASKSKTTENVSTFRIQVEDVKSVLDTIKATKDTFSS